ncbi:hypothetical protein [Ralstonia mannitolilytica]|uniref:hypothetical protein n=1 Tax=Ralstonia mannitolilytica TaxID=105219 RepID=UPI0028F66C14|nr:hypothetical protein [Ralstonia mannitolilytica]CAJ0717666.1 hypothetical protein LMG8323_03662 [Ralstonia mannitolilytica]
MLSAEQLATYNLKSVRNHGEGVTITAEHGRSIFLPDELLAAICAHRAVVNTFPAQPMAWLHRHGDHTEVSERQLDDGERSRGWTQEPLFIRPANMPAGPSPHTELLRPEAGTVSDVIRAIKSLARFKSPLDLPADSHIEIVAREIIATLNARRQAASASEDGFKMFCAYVERHYKGDVVFDDPQWHAKRLPYARA